MSKADKLISKINIALISIAIQGCTSHHAAPSEIVTTKRMYQYHFVESGETLESIARSYDMMPLELKKINQIKEPGIIHIGQRLHVHRREFVDHKDPIANHSHSKMRKCTSFNDACSLDEKPSDIEFVRYNCARRPCAQKKKRLNALLLPFVGIGALGATAASVMPSWRSSPSSFSSRGSYPATPTGGGGSSGGGSHGGGGSGGGGTPGGGGGGYPVRPMVGPGWSPSQGISGDTFASAAPLIAAAPVVGMLPILGAQTKTPIERANYACTEKMCLCPGTMDPLRLCWPINNKKRIAQVGPNGDLYIQNTLGEHFVVPAINGVISKIDRSSHTVEIIHPILISKCKNQQKSVTHARCGEMVFVCGPHTLRAMYKLKTIYRGLRDLPDKFGLCEGSFVTTIDAIGSIAGPTLFFRLEEENKTIDPRPFLTCSHSKTTYTKIK